jgi:integrase
MPIHDKKLSDSEARKLPIPASNYVIHWCPKNPGFGVRVTSTGARAWVLERSVHGKTVRRTLGAATGRGAISFDAAVSLKTTVSSELQDGHDRRAERLVEAAAEKAAGVTFADALCEYVRTKRRAKDGLPLKARTKSDYLAMIEPGHPKKDGAPTLDGPLLTLAEKPVAQITAAAIKDLHRTLAPRGERQQTYAMQVLRAVLRHHGVTIADNPLSPTTAGKGRVTLAPSRGKPSPIPAERLGAWWRAACAIDTPSAESLRFALLTGCRPGEVAAITVGDCDLHGGRVKLLDTKNRLDHTIILSKQALRIVKKAAEGKGAADPLFGIADAGKTLAAVNEAAETPGVSQHKLRHTFASVAEDLVSGGALRAMLNHAAGGDVTLGHYVHKGEAQLRAGWQTVADHIERCAKAKQ